MNDTLQDLMREATRLTRAGQLSEATAAIQRALAPPAGGAGQDAVPESMVLDGCVFEVSPPTPAADAKSPGTFTSGTHTHAGLTRRYKLYVPPGAAGQTLPLVVMLHGCTQDPDDFAAGTGMNERAQAQSFFVLYPAQAQEANPQRCWNWFKHSHQERGRGEPALLASLVQTVMARHGIDTRRVYVAGLSAGGAMAHIVAESYPEIFAAVGVHSGLPRGAATDLPGALAAMKAGSAGPSLRTPPRRAGAHVPTIVFHGDQDQTVHPRNGEQVLAAALERGAGSVRSEQGQSLHGRRYTRVVHAGADGEVGAGSVAEHWLVHGAGHAWSGGHAQGSYTDPSGPDATGEMLRFFFEHPHGG